MPLGRKGSLGLGAAKRVWIGLGQWDTQQTRLIGGQHAQLRSEQHSGLGVCTPPLLKLVILNHLTELFTTLLLSLDLQVHL